MKYFSGDDITEIEKGCVPRLRRCHCFDELIRRKGIPTGSVFVCAGEAKTYVSIDDMLDWIAFQKHMSSFPNKDNIYYKTNFCLHKYQLADFDALATAIAESQPMRDKPGDKAEGRE